MTCLVCAETATAGQAGATPEQAVSAGHSSPPEEALEADPCSTPWQAHLPCRQEGQKTCCYSAGMVHWVKVELSLQP